MVSDSYPTVMIFWVSSSCDVQLISSVASMNTLSTILHKHFSFQFQLLSFSMNLAQSKPRIRICLTPTTFCSLQFSVAVSPFFLRLLSLPYRFISWIFCNSQINLFVNIQGPPQLYLSPNHLGRVMFLFIPSDTEIIPLQFIIKINQY